MNALAKIRSAGFEIWLKDNGNIGIKPFDALTPQQLEFLKAHKIEIVEALAAKQTTNDPPQLNPKHKAAILAWLHFIGETDQAVIDDVLDYCASNPEALAYYLERSKAVIEDDRHHCRECLNLRNGYCIKQRFRPVDDIPRRCEDFNDSRN